MKLMESSLVLLNCVGIAWSSGVLKEIRLLNQRMKTVKAATYIVATLVCAIWTVPTTAADRPNIIVMMVDDMGFAGPSIAPYGNPHYKTPGMDRLASEGMLFTDFHASGAICSATRAGLVTGRYQQRAGIEAVIHPHDTHPEHRKGLHEDEVTFAELFKDAGYSTGLVGKWHLGYAAETPKYHPMNHGFDYFMGYVSGNIDYNNHWGDHMQHDWWHGRKETKEEGYTTHLINKYALEFIEQNKDKPFCLYIAHESPHSPVQGPDDPIQRGPGAKKRTTPHAEAMKQMILEMDKGVEQVRSKLVKLGLEKNTLFLFFSDNGDAPGTATGSPRFRGHKGSVYEGGTRVPAVAWWPGRIKAGTQAEDLSITLDVMPTILSVAGIDPPKERSLDGIDLSPVLFEQKALPARPLFWADLSNNGSRSEALRDGSWKLVVQHPKAKPGTFENEQVELFRLDKDISEKTNLADTEPKRAAAMLKQLKAWYADTRETASPQPGGWVLKPLGELPELLAASIYKSPNVDIAVPNGPYTLQLLLYEGWRSRSADIVIEGKTVRKAYDMFKEQGGNFDHGSVLRHTFTLTDGNIDIEIKGPLHLGGLILSKGKADSADRVAIVKSQAALDLKDVIKAINFGDTKDLNIGDVKFAAAAVNTTVDGVTNTAGGDVHSGEFGQKLPQIQKKNAAKRADAKGKPNVVVIFTDDLGWTDLGCYGSKFYETPHVDRLANQGAIFRNAYAACNVCSPTRAALMTGKYPQRVGFTDWLNPDRPSGANSAATALPAAEVTIGEAFQEAGYRTGYIGKWHLGPQEHAMPRQQGFDWQMATCKHGYPGSYFFPYKRNPKAYSTGDVPDLENGKPGDYLTDALTTRAIGFMEETVKQGERPFFLILGHYAVHTPIQAPQALIEKYQAKRQRMYGGKPLKTIPEYGNTRTRGRQGDPTYAGMVESLDTNVGRVVDALDKLGVTKDTIIVFTSDNGGESNRNGNGPFGPTCNLPLRAGKGWNYEGGIRVPAFITWPGHIDPATSSERVITMDIYPTLLELTGCKSLPDQHVDGQSLAPLLTGKSKSLHRSFLAWSKPHQRGASRPSAAIIKDDWKLIHYLGTESTELYNLDDDPGEASDLSASEAGKSSELLNILNKWTEETAFKKPEFFNGKDLTGWKGNDGYWSVKDGAVVGHSEKDVPKNEFIWSDVEVKDFYLTVDVKLTPDARNAGIQFRSKPVDTHGQALGYQADVGHDQVIGNVWGNLYHEHGRGKLDWNDRAVQVLKSGDWNRYEILAVGHRIWTAINGKLCVAIEDPKGELSGRIAFQLHGGAPQTVHYRNPTLTHNPKIELAGLSEKELLAELPKKELPYWSKLIMAIDPGSQGEAWAKPTFDHSKWKTMKVPGHFDTVKLPEFDGVVWFRKTIELSAEQAKATATVHLGQIDDMDVTWVNGTRVGGYENPGHHYTVRNYPIPAGVLKPGRNVIAVRVMDHGAPGGIAGKPEQIYLQLGDDNFSLANLWHFAPGASLAALNKRSEVPPLLRPLTRPQSPVPAFTDGFTVDRDQTIVMLGGTNALESGRHGYLETLLVAAHPQQNVRVRNLAWQADTVYQQQRPRNFYAPNKPDYGERDGRAKIEADIVFFWMGQTESLDGPDRIDEFTTAYKQHLDQIAEYTNRIVLVTPVPFSNPLRLEIDIQKRNDSLAVYVDAIRKIGRERKLPVVDLATAFGWGATPQAHSQNGLHLLPAGHWNAAQAVASQLGFADRVASFKWFDENEGDEAGLEPASAEKLREAIRQKNDLWFRYWRPTNWAFLYGNRQSTPSSRDHTNPSQRWFPKELENALPQLDAAERRVHETAQALFAGGSQARAGEVAQQARRLLAKKCFVCHGPDRKSEDAKETDLRLDLRNTALEYDAIVPGDAAASELMARITSQDPDSHMPPPGHGKPLTKDEVDVLRKWIQADAVYESHWSFRELQNTRVPEQPDVRSSGNPIDAFIRQRLQKNDVRPSRKADKRTLIRRVYADAIGMPPSPEEFKRFMDDSASDAYEQLVDRVLEDQHFGERWAQHWLDVARFAESGGFELDGMRPNAYQFRDFVIKAFNDDLPYNQFVQWQIAGDEFEPNNIEALKATGFLGCGVRNAVITKNQVEKERYDELDDILSTTMTAMLGLSVGCARCHDHKYDPITSIDYYRLLSTFTTTVRSEIVLTPPSAEVDKAMEVFERDHKKLVTRLADYEKEKLNSKSYTNPVVEHQPLVLSPWQATGPLKTTGYIAGHNAAFAPEKTPGSEPAANATWRKRPDLTDGVSHQINESNSVFFYHRTITAESATPTVLSFGADDTVKAWLNGKWIAERIVASAVNPDQALAHVTLPKGEHHLLVKIVNGPGIGGFYFNVKQQGVPKSIRNIVTIPVDGRNPQQTSTLRNWQRQFDSKWQQLSIEINEHLATKPKYPQKTVFVSTEGRKGFRPRIYNVQGPEFYDRSYILNRGNPNSKREPATQSFLPILMQHADNESHWIEKPPAESKSSYRRKSLANWMTDPKHGAGNLLARVIVNRLWQHHYGKGLVSTANDFGTQGALPTHPELLEWLAGELVRNNWSLKHIHRLIMTSETFQQESAFSENAARVDPENKLLWRFTPRRLEAEAIRDSILAVSGQLDRTMFGSGTLDPRQKRRSIYFTVKRSLLNPMLNLYDAPETLTSTGRRNSTTTAPQALLLINSPYIRELAQAFAARISPLSDDDLSTIVINAYRLALNREPSNNELQAATQFIEIQQKDYEQSNSANARSAALADFAQAVFSINEFVYVD